MLRGRALSAIPWAGMKLASEAVLTLLLIKDVVLLLLRATVKPLMQDPALCRSHVCLRITCLCNPNSKNRSPLATATLFDFRVINKDTALLCHLAELNYFSIFNGFIIILSFLLKITKLRVVLSSFKYSLRTKSSLYSSGFCQ